MDQLKVDGASSDDGFVAARSLRAVVWRGQFVAAIVLPIGLIVGAVLAGGGLLFAGFALFAVPLMLVLAVPPLLGRYAGKIRTLSQLPVAYCVVSIALWAVMLSLGYLMTSTQPAPLAFEPAPLLIRVLAQVCGTPPLPCGSPRWSLDRSAAWLMAERHGNIRQPDQPGVAMRDY